MTTPTAGRTRAEQPDAALADRLARVAPGIARRAMTIMYANPFWEDRFGERGRRFAEEDGRHHMDYLVESVRQGDVQGFERYARWLQTVLTTRGMCSAHLDENFDRIGSVILSESVVDGEVALLHLRAARAALCYPRGPARDVQDAGDRIGVAVRNALDESSPGWRDQWGSDSAARLTASVEWPVSYLADALALCRDDQFAGYLRWLADFAARRGIRDDLPDALLDRLNDALARLPGETERLARASLAAARAAAREPAPAPRR